MELEGLDYNTHREKLRLMAYGRDIHQMVELCMKLPTKEQRLRCAEKIIDAMKRVVPSQQSFKERTPVLWYHLALMSDFKLDIDYPVEIIHEDKMATPPDHIPYNKEKMPIRHYGRLVNELLNKLKTMPEGEERKALVTHTARQMYNSLVSWGLGTADKERVASDLARLTDGVIQVMPNEILKEINNVPQTKNNRRKRKKK
ncbi:MAG: DUF4290 domain-containing protein [Prevotella sp.]|nr:DUF4290 domain-containing protein [Candidatus Prevotella equi]